MTTAEPPHLILPAAPALAVHPDGAVWLSPDGEIDDLALAAAAQRLAATAPLLCHRRAVGARLGLADPLPAAFDVLELFAFVRPACFCVPTVRGLCDALGLPLPRDRQDEAASLVRVARHLLSGLILEAPWQPPARRADAQGIAWTMACGGWAWGPSVLAALGVARSQGAGASALRLWDRLSEWSEQGGESAPGSLPVDPSEARSRLATMLGDGAEQRPSQADYASAATLAFAPRDTVGAPHVVLAEAGTGTGKTLGYIAPSSLWAEKNQAPVWISTYTRNLQRQLDAELGRLYPDPVAKAQRVVIRKGRENYLCLLNLEDATRRLPAKEAAGDDAVALGLLVRWGLASRDGDMVGGDLPGWLVDLLGKGRTLGLADRRGECIYSACPHFRKCYIERAVRRARRAHIVVANHALVMVQAALGGLDDGHLPTRYVFDEGHHLFDAADNAFSASLCGVETAEVRRWLLGAESETQRSRARGLKRRCEDLLGADPRAALALDQAVRLAHALPAPGWHQRVADGREQGPCEYFLGLARQQVYARSADGDSPYSLECDPRPAAAGVVEAAAVLAQRMGDLASPLRSLAACLLARLDEDAADLDSATRQRIEAVARSIDRRALRPLAAWSDMLNGLAADSQPQFVDWFAVERLDGRDVDVAFHRHWVDPLVPFAKHVAGPAHGLLITSATLRDGSGDVEADWAMAERRTGAVHLPAPAVRANLPSPFDYAAATRALVVTDLRRDDLDQVAAAYRELFLAARGGGLGLFTAVNRLKEVWKRIALPLDRAGIDLLAQHVDGMDTGTIVDIFRAELDACLLGTDAVRDGVDVPGRSLRVIVFDRVPWPRPDILHKARRAEFGGRAYDDMIARLRLKQAFGRLIRRAGDAGVFVLLDRLMPSRLNGAFPSGVVPRRVGLAEAIAETADFLRTQ
jgi:ATP-dependent DNA helicase DinG